MNIPTAEEIKKRTIVDASLSEFAQEAYKLTLNKYLDFSHWLQYLDQTSLDQVYKKLANLGYFIKQYIKAYYISKSEMAKFLAPYKQIYAIAIGLRSTDLPKDYEVIILPECYNPEE